MFSNRVLWYMVLGSDSPDPSSIPLFWYPVPDSGAQVPGYVPMFKCTGVWFCNPFSVNRFQILVPRFQVMYPCSGTWFQDLVPQFRVLYPCYSAPVPGPEF